MSNAMFNDVSKSLVINGLPMSQNESRATGFPSEILTGGESTNSTNLQPITTQPAMNSNAQSSSSFTESSTIAKVPQMN